MKKAVLILIVVITSMGVAAQSNLKPRFGLTQTQINHIDTLLAQMAENNHANFNYGIWEQDGQWGGATKMQILNRMLTADEIYYLALHHPSPAVRVTAGNIIVVRYTQLAPQLVMEMLADSGVFGTSAGCFGYYDFVGSRILNVAVSEKHLSDSLLHVIDSLILLPEYRHIERRGDVVSRMALTDDNHALLLRLWQEDGQSGALLKLATFHRDADTTLVIAALQDKGGKRVRGNPYNRFPRPDQQALSAIAVWPHDAFKPHLEAIADENTQNTQFYEALLAYDTEWAAACIDSIFARLARNPKNEVKSYAPQGQMTKWAGEALYRAFNKLSHPSTELRRRLWNYLEVPRY